MKYWQKIVCAESKEGKWDFINDSDIKQIRIYKTDGWVQTLQITMTYEEWEEFISLIKRITK